MKFRFACAALALIALALSVPVLAQGTSPTSTLSGTVVSSSDTALVVKTDAGTERTFVVDSSSRLPSGLAAGTRVTVSYHIMDGGQLHAASVTTGGSSADPARTPSDPLATRTPADPVEADEQPLPATASNEWLLLFAGLLALSGGLVLRRTYLHG